MTAHLTDRIRRDGRSVETCAAWIDEWLDARWEDVWRSQLGHLQQVWEEIGEPAYGVYNRELFRPVQSALTREAFTCRPRLPGNLSLSEEHWGPEDFRERRMWTLLVDADGTQLGALVTRFFHDHTELRLPRRPAMEGLIATDHDVIRSIVLGEPAGWCRRR